jgi:hypothetical protein
MEQLVADGTVNVTFFFRPHDRVQVSFQFIFHNFTSFYKKSGRFFLPEIDILLKATFKQTLQNFSIACPGQ